VLMAQCDHFMKPSRLSSPIGISIFALNMREYIMT
jgi:hypothetical protein